MVSSKIPLNMIKDFSLLVQICFKSHYVLRVKSRFLLPCKFLHLVRKENDYGKLSYQEKKQVRKRISQFKDISLYFYSTFRCESSQTSFHILTQSFPR